MKSILISLGALWATTLAAPAPRSHVLHERRDALPEAFNDVRRLDGRTLLPMRIGLSQSNLHKGPDMLMDVSNPESENYGKYLSVEEIHELFAPAEDAVSAVRGWLESAGVAADRISQSVNKQWIQFDADAEEAERLLGTEYYIYTHGQTGRSHVGCNEYHVPAHIQEHIDYVTPGVKMVGVKDTHPASPKNKRTFGLPNPQPPLKKPLPITLEQLLDNLLGLCDIAVTPSCIQELYNITAGTTATPGNELGIFEDLAQYYSQTDLDLYFLTLYPTIPLGTHPTLKSIDGAPGPTSDVLTAGAEADLDFEISYPLIWPQNSVLYQVDDAVYEANYTYDGFFNNFLDAIDGSYCTYSAFGETGNSDIDPPYPDPAAGGYKSALQCGVYKPTNVISISYGGDEAGAPLNYQKRQCNEWMKLGLQGTSVVVASGDYGVGGSDGCLGPDGAIFNPDFPVTCPYITSVGATYLPLGGNIKTDGEVATSRFASGGGFSNIYPQPSYQQAAVSNFLTDHNPPYKYYEGTDFANVGANGGVYNRIGRGYPDVSAVGDNVLIYNVGAPTLIGGTSASAPVFASILTRINEERLAAGKSTVGFVNPVLYQNPGVLHDITSGTNPNCNVTGFSAAPGWDPVTGLGTPDYPAMLKLFMSL